MEKPTQPPLKDRILSYLNYSTLIALGIAFALLPQGVNILVGYLGVENELILDALGAIVNATSTIAGLFFLAAFALFFLKR